MNTPVREITVRIETGKVLRIITNDLTSPAQVITEIYKPRRTIEQLIRLVKQVLRITSFVGASEIAIRVQIAGALITFLLLRLAQSCQTQVASPLTFARLVRSNLLHRKSIHRLNRPEPRSQTTRRGRISHPAQTAIIWNNPALDHG